MKHITKIAFVGLGLTLVGCLGVTPTLYYKWSTNRAASFAAPTIITPVQVPKSPSTIEGHPNRIVINSVNIDLPVADGFYNKQSKEWSLSTTQAHFAVEKSQLPNNASGDTFLYAHARKALFGSLPNIHAGDEAMIFTDNSYKFIYRFRSSHAISPADTSIFGYQGAPILTLQTCTGLWSQNRQLFTFDLVKTEKV